MVEIWVIRGVDHDVFPWIGNGRNEKTGYNHPKHQSLGHNGAVTDLNMGYINRGHVDHTRIYLECSVLHRG